MDYFEKLKDPRWQKKRLEVFERDEWKCKWCNKKEKTLHVHHLFYFKDQDPWDIPDGFLITLCEMCHYCKPCREELSSCNDCPDYQKEHGCDGPGNAPKEIQHILSLLLNEIWKKDEVLSLIEHIIFDLERGEYDAVPEP